MDNFIDLSRFDLANMHLMRARASHNAGDYLSARVDYMKCIESLKQANAAAQMSIISKEYENFVRTDPIFKALLDGILPYIKENPGIIQSTITKEYQSASWAMLYNKNREISKEDVYYVLYFAEQLGYITRVKKGRSYELNVIE